MNKFSHLLPGFTSHIFLLGNLSIPLKNCTEHFLNSNFKLFCFLFILFLSSSEDFAFLHEMGQTFFSAIFYDRFMFSEEKKHFRFMLKTFLGRFWTFNLLYFSKFVMKFCLFLSVQNPLFSEHFSFLVSFLFL